ncbi:hypothetical protein B0H10DRAFT_1961239, partial [Mycena sp. CBHHK59/15]
LGTQQLRLQTFAARNCPDPIWTRFTASTRGVELGAVMEGEKDFQEYSFLRLEFVHTLEWHLSRSGKARGGRLSFAGTLKFTPPNCFMLAKWRKTTEYELARRVGIARFTTRKGHGRRRKKNKPGRRHEVRRAQHEVEPKGGTDMKSVLRCSMGSVVGVGSLSVVGFGRWAVVGSVVMVERERCLCLASSHAAK